MCILLLFFKQKTSDELRIRDWSSDVCSSDLDLAQWSANGLWQQRPCGRYQGESGRGGGSNRDCDRRRVSHLWLRCGWWCHQCDAQARFRRSGCRNALWQSNGGWAGHPRLQRHRRYDLVYWWIDCDLDEGIQRSDLRGPARLYANDVRPDEPLPRGGFTRRDRKSTRLNSSQ